MTRPVFNVRIYGVLLFEGAVLVSDEIHRGHKITKFPGGGLQFGEGTHEGLKREFLEELGIDIEIREHFYTTDFFQASLFDPSQQVISIYYLVNTSAAASIPVAAEKFRFTKNENGEQVFRWLNHREVAPEAFTLPIDKKVSFLLQDYFTTFNQGS